MDQDNSVQSDLIGMSRGGVGEKAFVTKTATLTGKQANVRGKKICVNSTYTISFINTDGGFDFAKFIFSLVSMSSICKIFAGCHRSRIRGKTISGNTNNLQELNSLL